MKKQVNIALLMPEHPQRAQDVAQLLKKQRPQWQIHAQSDYAGPCDTAIVWQPKIAQLSQLSGLKLIQNLGAGVDALFASSGLPDVPIARFMDASLAHDMADYVQWAILSHQFQARQAALAQSQHQWRDTLRDSIPPVQQVLVLGAGHLGQAVGRRLAQQGLQVTFYRRSEHAIAHFPVVTGSNGLYEAASQADVIVNLLPNTPATDHILNRPLFAACRRQPLLINAGRGTQLHEHDLLAALTERQLSGAVLDVFQSEPLPKEHPFWEHPLITITPHIAALSSLPALVDLAVTNTERVLAQQAPLFAVDPQRGY